MAKEHGSYHPDWASGLARGSEARQARIDHCLETRGSNRISTPKRVIDMVFSSDQRGSAASKIAIYAAIFGGIPLVAGCLLYDAWRMRGNLDNLISTPPPTQIVRVVPTNTPTATATILRPTEIPATATSTPKPDNKCPLPSCDIHWNSTTNVGAMTDAMSSGWVLTISRDSLNSSDGIFKVIDAQGKSRPWTVTAGTKVVLVQIRDDRYLQPGAIFDPNLFPPGTAVEVLAAYDPKTQTFNYTTAGGIKVKPRIK